MSRELSPELIRQMTGEVSDDPFLLLITLSHSTFNNVYLVNNTVDIVSRGQTYTAFPLSITLPVDDGESQREMQLELDNVSLELIDEIRIATTPINCKIEMILASNPDKVQIDYSELKIKDVTYSKQNIRARLYLDDFLSTEMTSEKYTPTNFRGIF